MSQTDLHQHIQRVFKRLDDGKATSESLRKTLVQAVTDTQAELGEPVDAALLDQTVDQVIAEIEQERENERLAAEAAVAMAAEKEKRRIPWVVWVVLAILAIPLMFPIARMVSMIMARLLRVAI